MLITLIKQRSKFFFELFFKFRIFAFMPSDKTRPIGKNVRNVPVTLPISELPELQKLSDISGCGRSPYIRTLVEWAIENRVIVRARHDEQQAYYESLGKDGTAERYRYEPVITHLAKPLVVMVERQENIIEIIGGKLAFRSAADGSTPPIATTSEIPAAARRKAK